MVSTGLQLRMTCWRSSPNVRIVSSSRSKQRSMQILFSLLISPDPSCKSTSWSSCPGHQEGLDSYSSQLTHSPNGWKLCQWWILRKKQQSSSCRVSYTGLTYLGGFWQITKLSSKQQKLQDVARILVYTISHHQQHILRWMGKSSEQMD
jgi:hypothetical protein